MTHKLKQTSDQKLMIFQTILNRIKEKFGISENGNWISERLNEIELHRDNFDTLAFRIVELKAHGFLTKVKGLYAFISFYHMPWKYYDIDSWTAIAPSLTDKKFYCKIHKIDKETRSIILNGEIPQFKKAELKIGEEYKGLIVKVSNYGIFIDIGYHFDWKCGSLIGLLHKSLFADYEKISNFKLGQETKTIFQELNENGQLTFCNNRDKTDWQMEKLQELIGQTTWAQAIRNPDSQAVHLLVKGRYKASIAIKKKKAYLSTNYRKRIIHKKNELTQGEIITCEVTGLNKKTRTLKINWLTEINTDTAIENSILSNLDEGTVKKLEALKSTIENK